MLSYISYQPNQLKLNHNRKVMMCRWTLNNSIYLTLTCTQFCYHELEIRWHLIQTLLVFSILDLLDFLACSGNL